MEKRKRQYSNSDTIYRRLEAYFATQPFNVGDRVPPERTLAETLNANRTTLRNALQRMVKEGVLTRHVGRGTFFTALPAARHRQQPLGSHASPHDLRELRLQIEPEVGALAAGRLPAEVRARIQRYEASLPQIMPGSWLTNELSVSQWLAEATGNSLFVQLAHMIGGLRREQETELPSFTAMQRWRTQQQLLCSALLARNADHVRQLLKTALTTPA